uniref:PDZ domain-containing protein n=1 Tax=Wuchereria bancrofti TaxID=6293 RepID=A0AAF5PI83_WUCBA
MSGEWTTVGTLLRSFSEWTNSSHSVLPNGRADQEGVRIGDIVETINGKHCTSYKMFNAKVRGARDVLRLRFIR